MKRKILMFILIFILTVVFSGCGSSPDAAGKAATATVTLPTINPTVAAYASTKTPVRTIPTEQPVPTSAPVPTTPPPAQVITADNANILTFKREHLESLGTLQKLKISPDGKTEMDTIIYRSRILISEVSHEP